MPVLPQGCLINSRSLISPCDHKTTQILYRLELNHAAYAKEIDSGRRIQDVCSHLPELGYGMNQVISFDNFPGPVITNLLPDSLNDYFLSTAGAFK